MTVRLRPPEGQQCECDQAPEYAHDYGFDAEYEGDLGWACCDRPPEAHGWPNHGGKLKRVYWDKGDGRRCYAWWCANCREWLPEADECWEPCTDERGRFAASVHCQTIPGLD